MQRVRKGWKYKDSKTPRSRPQGIPSMTEVRVSLSVLYQRAVASILPTESLMSSSECLLSRSRSRQHVPGIWYSHRQESSLLSFLFMCKLFSYFILSDLRLLFRSLVSWLLSCHFIRDSGYDDLSLGADSTQASRIYTIADLGPSYSSPALTSVGFVLSWHDCLQQERPVFPSPWLQTSHEKCRHTHSSILPRELHGSYGPDRKTDRTFVYLFHYYYY